MTNAVSSGVLGFFTLLSVSAYAASETREFDAKNLTEVTVDNPAGKTRITATDGPKATVSITRNTFSDSCELIVEQKGDELNLEVKKTSMFADCNVDFDVRVPKAVDLDLSVGSGNLAVQGIQGELEFSVGSGNIVADGTFKKIEGKAGSGDIEVKGLTGGGELKTGSGGINVTFGAAALKGELDLKTGSGDATLMFPKAAKIKTAFSAGSGKLSSELTETPSADFKVSMSAGSGDLKIKTY